MSEILNMVNTTIHISGETCDYETLTLRQSMNGHHTFNILVNYKPNKPSLWTVTPETVFEQLGETVDIKMEHRENGEITEFTGIVTHIEVGGQAGDQGYARIYGGSPTLLLDMGPSMDSYTDYTLSNILSEELENSGVRMEVVNKPRFAGTLPYAVKYKETSYQFLARLAASCGDWFYYSGTKLILGNPKNEDTTRAAFDIEIKALTINARLQQLHTELYDYDPAIHDFKEDAPPENIDGVNSYMRVAKDRSRSFFPKPAKLPSSRQMVNEGDIIEHTRAHHSRQYSHTSVFQGQSNTCAIRLGELVTTRLPESLQKDVGPDLGRYRVIEITHQIDHKGLYSNIFKGVAGLTEALPLPENVTPPIAFPEPAIVIDNADPKNVGRVQVRFFWQSDEQNSNWLRVQTPDAGTSSIVEKNRGLLFVPEIDDQVMVAYEQGNPSRPYVAGSLFHGANSGGMAPDNNLKSITTRSGHTIEFDDTDGEEKINIRDNGGSVITFDTKEKSLIISSVENIDISAKNIRLSAQENVSIGARQNVEIAAEADVNTLAKGNVAMQSDGDTNIAAKGALTAEATADATINGQNVTIEGKVAADLIGMQTSVQGQMTAVQGASGKMEVM